MCGNFTFSNGKHVQQTDGKHGVEHTAPFSAFSERLPVESETKTYGAILRESALCSLRQGSLAPHFAQFANKDAATWTCTGWSSRCSSAGLSGTRGIRTTPTDRRPSASGTPSRRPPEWMVSALSEIGINIRVNTKIQLELIKIMIILD